MTADPVAPGGCRPTILIARDPKRFETGTLWNVGRLSTIAVMLVASWSYAEEEIRSEISDLTKFTPTRVEYDSVGGYGESFYYYEGRRWERWETDYPQAEHNFAKRVAQLTLVDASRVPLQRRLTDENLGDSPLIFMSDVGYMQLTTEEKERLRAYLENGGFLWADDFWGDAEWLSFERMMRDVLPGRRWHELSIDHPIFHTVFDHDEMPQIPARDFAWRGTTAEPRRIHKYPQGSLEQPSIRAYLDDDGRIMAIGSHNTDIADGWEREAYGEWYFERFSTRSYRLGINVIVYAMSH